MTKIVYNGCYVGFGLSHEGMKRYCQIKGIAVWVEPSRLGYSTYWTVPEEQRTGILDAADFHSSTMEQRIASNQRHTELTINDRDIPRHDSALVQVVEELGDRANDRCAKLMIEEIDGRLYRIEEYDGYESVATPEGTEWIVAEVTTPATTIEEGR